VKCGCGDEKVEIYYVYYDEESLEINGAFGSIESRREILLSSLKETSG